MSVESHGYLKNFLTKYGHITIMQMINILETIIRKIMDTNSMNEDVADRSLKNKISINGPAEHASGTSIDCEMRELQEAIRLIRNNAHQPLKIMTVHNAVENASCGRIAPNMNKLVAGFSTSEIRLWEIGDTVLTLPKYRPSTVTFACDITSMSEPWESNVDIEEAGAIVLRGHTDVVHDLRFVSESEILLSVSSDKDMRAWRLNDYSCAAVYNGHNYPVWCMDTSVFNLYIATGSHDRTAKLWSLDRKFPLRIFAGHFLDVNCIKFHPNARYLATGSADKTIRLWNKDDASLLRVYVGAQSTIYSLVFSPDGKYLAAAGDDKCIYVWDLATNALLTELKGHEDTVMNLDWSSDGQYLASASMDGIVRLWLTQEHINNSTTSGSANSTTETNSPRVFSTNCSSILSLQYCRKNNSLVCIGTA